MNMNKSPSSLQIIGDCKAHYLRIPAPSGEQAYMFYALVPGPICKMFFLFMNKISMTDLAIWTDKSTPNSPTKWPRQLRNVNAENDIKKGLIKDAEQLQSILANLGLLNFGQPK